MPLAGVELYKAKHQHGDAAAHQRGNGAVEGRRLFGVEHVSRRAVAFFHDLAGQLVAAALAHVDVDAGLGLKGLGEVVA